VHSLTEGDLILGRKNLSAIGTLVEPTTNYTMLLHLPDGYTLELVRDALAAKIKTLPDVLRASLTWDQGPEMGKWKQVTIDYYAQACLSTPRPRSSTLSRFSSRATPSGLRNSRRPAYRS
jgi:IS30 family transposase